MNPIENTYQEVLLSKPDRPSKRASLGIVRVGDVPVTVGVYNAPAEEGETVIAAFRTCVRNATPYGNFITRKVASDFEPMPLREVILYGRIEDDMKFKGTIPTGDEIQKYFSHSNFSFLYVGTKENHIFCKEMTYSKRDGWDTQKKRPRPKIINRVFNNKLRDDVTRLMILDQAPLSLDFLKYISSSLGMNALKMERCDE